MPLLTTQQAFELALQRYREGRLADAEQLYRQILAQQPAHADSIHLLGVIAHRTGRDDIAVDLIGRAAGLMPDRPEVRNNLGAALRSRGQLDQAVAAFRQAIALRPDYPEAYANLGATLADKGQFDDAISACRQAIALKPSHADAHCNLGIALKETGRVEEAIAEYRLAIALNPQLPEAHSNLGIALADAGQLDGAIVEYRNAISLRPNYAEAYYNLGVALARLGTLDEAIGTYRQAISLRPNNAKAYNNLGNVLKGRGQLDEAIAAYCRAIALRPDNAEAHNNLGAALSGAGRSEAAIAEYRRAIVLDPHFIRAYSNLGNDLKDAGQLDEAVAACRQAIALRPDYAIAYNNLGNALKDQGLLDEAIAAFGQAIALEPGLADVHGNLILSLHFSPDCDGRRIAHELRRWNLQHAEPLRGLVPNRPGDRTPDRRLRIGYVSPDFRDHVVGRNILPLFGQHDRRQFEIYCYSNASAGDAMTAEFRQHADRWRNISGLSDEQAAQQIQDDSIDILVDLALHTAHNRLLVFARKPAPIQVTFAGYPGSTGLSAIDYRLSDPYLDPPGIDESIYSEQTIRLPDSFWCYDPLDHRDLPVNSLPALENGFATFGCLNNFGKINDRVLALWARVLEQVENSRLLLLTPPGSHRQRTLDRLSQEGIAPERTEFVARAAAREYLELYHQIDLGLDSFPYNGHNSSLDAFWMGVPVVTLMGQMAVSRAGWCQAANLGLRELAAQTPEHFAEIVVGLAANRPRLKELRATLRQRMERSPLMDGSKFARGIEAAYREMWRNRREFHAKN